MNRTNHNTLLLAMLGGLALSASAWGGGDKFKTMDNNGDGRISSQEHAAGAKAMFDKIDANRDGSVTAAEMDAGHGMMVREHKDMGGHGMHHGRSPGGMMKKMDSNGDGVLTAAEHAAVAQARFDRLDADHDGRVTAAEMEAGHRMTKGDRKAKDHKGGMHRRMSSADKIGKMDSNRDGVLSAGEHAAGAQAKFGRMDSNRDGYLSRDEMKAGHAAMMKAGMREGGHK